MSTALSGWCELLSTDPPAAIEFYTNLLGVESETATMPDGTDYTVYMAGEVPVAGTMEMPAQVREMNIPSHWSVYFDVDDVDETYNKAMSTGRARGPAAHGHRGCGQAGVCAGPPGCRLWPHNPVARPGSVRLRSGRLVL